MRLWFSPKCHTFSVLQVRGDDRGNLMMQLRCRSEWVWSKVALDVRVAAKNVNQLIVRLPRFENVEIQFLKLFGALRRKRALRFFPLVQIYRTLIEGIAFLLSQRLKKRIF